jgi:hypothetical protein
MATRALLVLAVLTATASADPAKLTVGIYAPTIEFGTAQARLAYVQGLAKAIERATGIDTQAQSYATLAALDKDKVDLAIIDGPCLAVRASARLVAVANVGGSTTRTWALYSSAGSSLQALRGNKLAYVALGCSDAAFVDNAMLDSELDAGFFAARLGEKDLSGAIASVTSYKTAHAVFAPIGSAKGLTKVLDGAAVPNPALVAQPSLSAALTDEVSAAVLAYSTSGPIASWTRPSRDIYTSFAARLAPIRKSGVFATPEPIHLDARDVLVDLPTLSTPASVPVRQHFVRPATARMD